MTGDRNERGELEARLVREPFDHGLRLEYALLLETSGEVRDALMQYRLVLDAEPARVEACYGAVRSLVALGESSEARALYRRARGLARFTPQPDLEPLLEGDGGERVHLRAIEGGAAGEVVHLDFEPEPRVRFRDVAGMADLKKSLRLQIIEPFLRPGLFQRFRKQAGGGVLLYGPPGCGKTLMARAIASECGATFLSVDISDVLNLWLGESERNLAALFDKARANRPSVLFFDELDALAFSRAKAASEHSRTVVNEFLAQLDGFDHDNRDVLVLAASNMPWDIDPAMKRPGRFSRQIFVPPPDAEARRAMLEMKLAGVPAEAVDCAAVAVVTPGFSGADIDGLIDLAKEYALEEIIASNDEGRLLTQADLLRAARSMTPSTSEWLRTARNLVKYAGADGTYRDVEKYLKGAKLL